MADQKDAIETLVKSIAMIVKEFRLRQDNRGCWFSNNQLDVLRKLYSFGGYEKARLYQSGKIDKRGNPYEINKNKALLKILEAVHESRLEPKVCSYVIGKLNQVLENY